MERFYFEVPGIGRKEDAIAYINEFLEYGSDINGSGGLDPRDVTTGIAVKKAAREDGLDGSPTGKPLEANAGCATMAPFIVLPILAILIAL